MHAVRILLVHIQGYRARRGISRGTTTPRLRSAGRTMMRETAAMTRKGAVCVLKLLALFSCTDYNLVSDSTLPWPQARRYSNTISAKTIATQWRRSGARGHCCCSGRIQRHHVGFPRGICVKQHSSGGLFNPWSPDNPRDCGGARLQSESQP